MNNKTRCLTLVQTVGQVTQHVESTDGLYCNPFLTSTRLHNRTSVQLCALHGLIATSELYMYVQCTCIMH